MRYLLKLTLLLGVLVFATSCTKTITKDQVKTVVRISQRNEPSDLDAGTASLPDDYFIIRALSEGLVVPSSKEQATQAAAAINWSHSTDEKIWTFHLRPNAKWSNGDPVTSYDFVESYRRVLTPATLARKVELLFPVKNAQKYMKGEIRDFAEVGFSAPDPLTLIVILDNPMPEFLMYASSGIWIPVHMSTVNQWGKQWTKPEHFVGNGPYLLKKWIPGQKIVVEKNPNYHGAEKIRVSELEFIRFDDSDAEERSFRSGGVDVTMSTPVSKIAVYKKERPLEIHRSILAETRFLAFNIHKYPLNDPRVRVAISLALDRDKLVSDVLKGGQQSTQTIVPEALWRTAQSSSFALPLQQQRERDLARAKRLLADSGYPNGSNFPTLELSSWTNISLLEAIQATLKKDLGITVTLSVREARVHINDVHSGNYSIALMTIIPEVADPLAVLENFSTNASNNYLHFSDPVFDETIAKARTVNNLDTRLNMLKDAENRLLNLAPLAPLYVNTQNWLMQTHVKGWYQDPLWTRSYLDLDLSN